MRIIEVVVESVESTAPVLVWGLMTRASGWCASMWSGPLWASSTMAVSLPYAEWVTASTLRPSVRSLSAR